MSHINKAIAIRRNEILTKNPIENDEKVPLIVTFNRTFLDLRHMINKNCHILQREPKLKNFFNNPPVIAFGGSKLYNNKKLIHTKAFDEGKCHTC